MPIVVMGVSYRSAPLELLERANVAAADLPKALTHLTSLEHVSEAVLVSTCNRTEAYVVAEKFHAAYAELRDYFADTIQTAPEQLADHTYAHHDGQAARHLFALASGLESAVFGETEIAGQVRTAWDTARTENAAGSVLNHLFRHAVETAKRVRTDTGISRHTASVSHAAVEMATRELGTLTDRTVLVVGAGDVAHSMVAALAAAGPSEVLVANRSTERAALLADRVGGRAIGLNQLEDALAEVDLLLTSTGATSVILEAAHLDRVVARRAGRPLLIVDIAVPRDVDQSAAEIAGVTLLDMDDLTEFAAAGRAERRNEETAARQMVDDEVDRYELASSAREMAPLIASLRGTAEATRAAELERLLADDGAFTPQQRDAVDRLTKSLVAKLLHEPTVALKRAAGQPKGDRLANSLRDLFDL